MGQRMAGVMDDFDEMAEHMGKVMDDMLHRKFVKFRWDSQWHPAVNVYETENRYLFCVDLAGMDRRSIDVRVDGKSLVVSGVRAMPRPKDFHEDMHLQVMEIDEGSFSRQLPLPDDSDPDGIAARYANGFLWVDLPKHNR